MTRRRWLVAVLAAALAMVAIASVAFAVTRHGAGLRYSVMASSGRVDVRVSDARSGKHTVVTVLSKDTKNEGMLMCLNYGDGGGGFAECPLPPGTYRWAVYDVDGTLSTGKDINWARQDCVATGEVTVP